MRIAILVILGGLLAAAAAHPVAPDDLPAAESRRPRLQEPALQKPWWDRAGVVPSRYYRIKSDLPPEELRELAAHLDRTFEAYRDRLGSLRQNLPTSFDVMIFRDPKDYQTTLSFEYGVNAAGSGGMFFRTAQGRSALAFFTGGQPRRRVYHVLQHEGFHQVASALFPGNLPPWLNEGLAEFFGEGILVGNKLVIGQTNPRVIDTIRDAIETDSHIPFRRMLTMDGRAWNDNVAAGSAALQYQQAWSMVHFLIYGDGGKYADAFSGYLRYLNAGFASYDSFVRAFGTDDIESFEERWKEYASAQKPSSFATALERAEFLAAGVLELARREIYPASMDELRDKLEAIDFTYSLQTHGFDSELRAAEPSMYAIPGDDLTGEEEEPPGFVLEPARPKPRTRQERRWESENPTPPTIRTVNLRPNNVEVIWRRHGETGELFFDLAVR